MVNEEGSSANNSIVLDVNNQALYFSHHSTLISLIPMQRENGNPYLCIVMRDASGKFCWEVEYFIPDQITLAAEEAKNSKSSVNFEKYLKNVNEERNQPVPMPALQTPDLLKPILAKYQLCNNPDWQLSFLIILSNSVEVRKI